MDTKILSRASLRLRVGSQKLRRIAPGQTTRLLPYISVMIGHRFPSAEQLASEDRFDAAFASNTGT